MPRPRPSDRHPDLFALEGPPPPMAAAERMGLLVLVSVLLMEALTAGTAGGAGDEDHA